MPNDLQSLANSLEKKIEAIEKAASQSAKDAAMAVITDLAFVTPVDTSQALSNWVVTLDSPANHSIPAHSYGFGGSTKGVSAGETISLAVAVIAQKKPGQPIYITNNVEYIDNLDKGSSKQFSGGFARRSEVTASKAFERFTIKD